VLSKAAYQTHLRKHLPGRMTPVRTYGLQSMLVYAPESKTRKNGDVHVTRMYGVQILLRQLVAPATDTRVFTNP
jgi:hypothetical protein